MASKSGVGFFSSFSIDYKLNYVCSILDLSKIMEVRNT